MVCFQSSTPWPKLTSFNSSYFGWLRTNNVYLNQTKFKTSTLVPCGFLVGAHPGFLCCDEAESELYTHLMTDSDNLPFQLTAHTISVPIHGGKLEKYTFQAVVVETTANQAAALRESFYKLANPLTAHLEHPYTGKYPFVALLQSKEWTSSKILRLAQYHVSIIQELKSIFIGNLQNIHNVININGETLLQGFYGMTKPTLPTESLSEPTPLLHSVHDTGNKTTKVALVKTSLHEEALNQLAAIHEILTANVSQEYHQAVFVNNARAMITGRQIDSISSCNYSSYTDRLLSNFNPQEGEDGTTQVTSKCSRLTLITYAAALQQGPDQNTLPNLLTSISSISSTEIDQLYDKMKHHIKDAFGDNPSVKTEELEEQYKLSTQEIQGIKDQLI